MQGGDTETARVLLALARDMETGGVKATQDIIAKNLVTGLQYLGQDGTPPTIEQFQRELLALRERLAQVVTAGEIEDKYEAEDAQKAIDRAIEQTQGKEPDAKKITAQIETAATIINKTATVAESLGKVQAFVIKLAPVVTALKHVASWLF